MTDLMHKLPNNLELFSSHQIRQGEPELQPIAAYVEGNAWTDVYTNQVAILTPLSSTPVDIYYQRKEKKQVVNQNEANSFLVLPGVQFRIQPDGIPFHLAVVPAEKVNSQEN